MLIKVARYV